GGVRGAPGRVLREVPERADPLRGDLARPEPAAAGGAAEAAGRRGGDGVLDDGLGSLQVRPEQAAGGRLPEGPDVQPGDLATLTRGGGEGETRGPARAPLLALGTVVAGTGEPA